MKNYNLLNKLKDQFFNSGEAGNNQVDNVSEKGKDYYNKVFDELEMFHVHYTSSPYYGVWTVILDRIRHIRKGSILEIGCGTGQLAWALYDSNLANDYLGFDFSEVAIKYARRLCPKLKFIVANALETDLYATFNYDIIISTEFLEHVELDIDVIKSIRAGATFIGSVPNYPFRSHIRHFSDIMEVINRYSEYFTSFKVIPIRVYETKIIYLFQGVKN